MKADYDSKKGIYVVEMSLDELDIIGRLLRWSVRKYREREHLSAVGGDINTKCRREAEKREKMCDVLYYGKEVTDD